MPDKRSALIRTLLTTGTIVVIALTASATAGAQTGCDPYTGAGCSPPCDPYSPGEGCQYNDVNAPYDPAQRQPTIQRNGPFTLIARPGSLPFRATLTLAPFPPQGSRPGGAGAALLRFSSGEEMYSLVQVRNADTGTVERGGTWDPPLELIADLPAETAGIPDEELSARWVDPNGWHQAAALGTRRALAAGETEGSFVTGVGSDRELHVLTRHAWVWGFFRGRGEGASGPSGDGQSPGGTASTGPPAAPPPLAPPASPLPLATTGPARAAVQGTTFTVSGRVVRVPCRVDGDAIACRVTATTSSKSRRGRRVRRSGASVVVGRGTAPVIGGRADVPVRLTGAGRRLLRRASAKVTLRVEAIGGRPAAPATTRRVTFRAARRSTR